MTTRTGIRVIRHEAVPKTGSFEVRFEDGRPSKFFYWNDVAGRRLRPDQFDRDQALQLAKAFAQAKRAELNGAKPVPPSDSSSAD